MTAIRAAPRMRRKRQRIRAEFMRIPWNAKQIACDSCGETEPVPSDLLLRFRLKTCLSCLTALAH
ncbi:MAG TPA: hypothetical protein VGQ65_11510 [Thermoanaerobaculia bacterium]|jgi:hypothetical protein|nr:hypothetical protein [Thermoanaerobaculia bacterium]